MMFPKLWYSMEDLCKDWKCSPNDILHLAEVENLSLFVDWHKLEREFVDSEFYFVERPGFSASEEFKPSFIEEVHFSATSTIDSFGRTIYPSAYSDSKLVKLAYVGYNVIHQLQSNGTCLFERVRVKRKREAFRNEQNEEDLHYMLNTGLYIKDYELVCYHWNENDLSITTNDLVITHAEKLRFEKNMKAQEDQGAYSTFHDPLIVGNSSNGDIIITKENITPWLEILSEAIQVQFSANRDRDPKKDTVIEWIIETAKSKGIAPSENIASAIFTIIKPIDHDPRKRKG